MLVMTYARGLSHFPPCASWFCFRFCLILGDPTVADGSGGSFFVHRVHGAPGGVEVDRYFHRGNADDFR